MVCHGNHVEVECLAQALKLPVSQFACRHLYRHLALGGIGHRVEVHHLARHPQCVAQLCGEALVAVALLAPQVEVAVHPVAAVSQVCEHLEQCHRVGPAAQCHQHPRIVCQQLLLAYELLYSLSRLHYSIIWIYSGISFRKVCVRVAWSTLQQ